jgi:hypothetical protein
MWPGSAPIASAIKLHRGSPNERTAGACIGASCRDQRSCSRPPALMALSADAARRGAPSPRVQPRSVWTERVDPLRPITTGMDAAGQLVPSIPLSMDAGVGTASVHTSVVWTEGVKAFVGPQKEGAMPGIRRRSKWGRAGDRRRRPRTPAPTTGWLIHELSQMTQTYGGPRRW